ncbi:MAG TPA: hypothetical protein GX743_07655 [Actinomycetales bacterium]|nr:hypothetical protein [Actinomycetales bacterium]
MSEKKSPVITEYPDAPVPTRWTKSTRQNPIVQFPKFVGAAVNIMMMVIKGHEK